MQFSRFYTDLNIAEKEAPKTTTYANEWSTPRNDFKTRIPFVTKSRPPLNTNFEREWTATDVRGQVRPSRPVISPASNGIRNTVVNYDPRGNNNWNTLGSRRPPFGSNDNGFVLNENDREQRPLVPVERPQLRPGIGTQIRLKPPVSGNQIDREDVENEPIEVETEGLPNTGLLNQPPSRLPPTSRPTTVFNRRPPFRRPTSRPLGNIVNVLCLHISSGK